MPPKKRRGANKPPKDVNAPKRPSTPYFLFASSRRGDLKEQHPDKRVTELSKLIAGEWKLLDDDAKKPFSEKFSSLQKKYKAELTEYKESDMYKQYQKRLTQWKQDQEDDNDNSDSDEDVAPKQKLKLPKKPKDTNAPKRPPASYFIFQNKRRSQIREEDPTMKMKDIAKKIGAEWQSMSAEEKQEYESSAQVLKQKYQSEMSIYKETDNFKAHEKIIKKWKQTCQDMKNEAKQKAKRARKKKQESESDNESESESGSGSESASRNGNNGNNNESDSGSESSSNNNSRNSGSDDSGSESESDN